MLQMLAQIQVRVKIPANFQVKVSAIMLQDKSGTALRPEHAVLCEK